MLTEKKQIFVGNIINVSLETTCLPNHSMAVFEMVRHPGGAGVIALNNKAEIGLIKQYRYAVDDWIWEIPAGKIDKGESPLTTAKRELQEETGITAKSWQTLGKIYSSPGFCDEVITLYLARDIHCGKANQQQNELISLHWFDYALIQKMCHDNLILDAKTLISLSKLSQFL